MTLSSSSSSYSETVSSLSPQIIIQQAPTSKEQPQETDDQPVSVFQRKFKSSPASFLSKITIYFVPVTTSSDKSCKAYKIQLNPEELTTSIAVDLAIQKFNQSFKLNLLEGSENYQLYVAKKSGRRQSDFPAIQNEQFILKTKINNFSLVPLYDYDAESKKQKTTENLNVDYLSKPQKFQTIRTITTIKSQMNMINNPEKRQKEPGLPKLSRRQKFFHCFCIN